ncbi:MAG: thioredoxin domain-containing protein [Bacteroidales bacterium]|nr:thioredoxin domain-containing protein [Bacteroidales bacterium]
MKRLKLSSRAREYFNWSFIILSIIFLLSLFIFKDDLTGYASKVKISQIDSLTASVELKRVDSAYNYTQNGLPYKVTFLEFGATGCSSCKIMEGVMEEVRNLYPDKVNVVFTNVRLKESKNIMDFFGVITIPMQVLLDRKGKEFFRHNGVLTLEEFNKVIEEYI